MSSCIARLRSLLLAQLQIAIRLSCKFRDQDSESRGVSAGSRTSWRATTTRPPITSAVKLWPPWRSQSSSDGMGCTYQVMGPMLCTAMHNSNPASRQEFLEDQRSLRVPRCGCGQQSASTDFQKRIMPGLYVPYGMLVSAHGSPQLPLPPYQRTTRTQSPALRRPGMDEDGHGSPG